MRLTSEPKPIKIRIVSGGKEHSSLDSLLHCFCLPDLQKVDKQLLQWLMRQGEEGNRIGSELGRCSYFLDASTVDEYWGIYNIFFPKQIEENNIHSLHQLLTLWYGKTEYDKNAQFIIDLAFEKDEDIALFCKNKMLKIEEVTDSKNEGIKQLDIQSIVQKRKSLYPMVSKKYLRRWIGYLLSTKTIDGHLFDIKDAQAKERELELKKFVLNCDWVRWNTFNGYNATFIGFPVIKNRILPSAKEEDFNSIEQFYELLEKDYLFCAKVFVLLLVDIATKNNHLNVWKQELVNVYSPAAYMDNQKNCDELNSIGFKNLPFASQMECFICDYLFMF